MNQAEDVKIVLAHNRHYKFHSGTLARNSPLFASMLSEPLAAKLSNKAKNAGVKVRWMIELERMPDAHNPAGKLGLVVSFVPPIGGQTYSQHLKDLTNTGERADGRTGLILNENGRVPTKIFDYYEAILYAFYNVEIKICDTDMGSALNDCAGMLQVADYLGCINVISKPIEVALTKHGQLLFRYPGPSRCSSAIQAHPAAWATSSLMLQSELIFREALVHLSGNWKRLRADSTTIERLRERSLL
jgi:hypothetical protein